MKKMTHTRHNNVLYKFGALTLVFALSAGSVAIGDTSAVWNTTVPLAGNVVSAGVWEEENGSVPGAGDVVINEIMWMGSSAHFNDQWIELRNMTDSEIDIGKWTIENARASNGTYMIPASRTIPAHGFFLITRQQPNSANSALAVPTGQQNGSISLANDYEHNGALILRDADGNIIDATPEPTGGSWPEGFNQTGEKRWSMQRGETPGDGTDPDNWYTCDRDVLEDDGTLTLMMSYWKEGHQEINCGTPGHMNLSSNDPTKSTYVAENKDEEESLDMHSTTTTTPAPTTTTSGAAVSGTPTPASHPVIP
jgi:hypothetical protein